MSFRHRLVPGVVSVSSVVDARPCVALPDIIRAMDAPLLPLLAANCPQWLSVHGIVVARSTSTRYRLKLQHISVRGVLVVPCHCPWCCCHTRLCSQETWSPMDWPMQCWCLCWCCTGVLARIGLAVSPALCCRLLRCCASLPLLHGHLRPCCAGLVTCVAPALPSASRTGICPITTQS